MTAPPTTRMPLFTANPRHMRAASPYLSPTSTIASGSSFPWNQMPPHVETNVSRQRQSRSPPTAGPPASDGEELTWVVGGTPAELRSKKNMTLVRKKAMDSFLKHEKKDRSRLNSEASSRSSIGSNDGVPEACVEEKRPSKTVQRRKRPSSSTTSPVANSHDQGVSSTEVQVVRASTATSSVLGPTPIYLPMRTGVVLAFDIHESKPLVSIGESLDPFRTMFQSAHPRVSVENLKYHCSRFFGTWALGKYWIPACLEYPHTFLSTLYLAAAHHDIIYGQPVESLATTALRQEIIHLVGRNMLNPVDSVADHNIVAVSQLIIGEVIGRKEAALMYHEAGMETMIKQRGGLYKLGIHGRLASAASWVNLASAILRESKPRQMYADFCTAKSIKNYPYTATVPESPLYCPRGKFITVQGSKNCSQDALDILGDIRMMIDIFLHETKQSRRNSQTLQNLYKKITTEYLTVSQQRGNNVLLRSDWKYEAIRLTAIIQATAIMRRCALSEALIHATNSKKPSSLYTSSTASRSNDSLVSPFDMRHDTPVTEYSTSPSYSMYSTSPAIQQNGFPFHSQRPSFSSTRSSSSDLRYFPPPSAPAPTGPTTFLQSLKDALENSNLSDCWSDMAGVLLWIGLVIGAASRQSENQILKKYYSATAMRAGIMLCFDHPEAIHATMVRMAEIVDGLRPEGPEQVARNESEGSGKRRRM